MSYQKLQAHNANTVTPDDNKVIKLNGRETRGCVIYCGVTGDIAVTTTGGETVTFKNVPQGMVLPVQVIKVLATGTTATDLISLH
tara:strand:- start:2998 stop:3252 length:255 start_codon:yes stop_codon:yes gene_type:complete